MGILRDRNRGALSSDPLALGPVCEVLVGGPMGVRALIDRHKVVVPILVAATKEVFGFGLGINSVRTVCIAGTGGSQPMAARA